MNITEHNFKETIIDRSHQVPVIVQFYAPWCGPCRVLKPVLQQVHQQSEQNWDLLFVNVKDNQNIARQLRIFTVPDVRMFKAGQIIAGFTGAKPAYIIQNWLDRNLPEMDEQSEYAGIERYLQNNDIESAKEALLHKAIQENPQSETLKLLMALHHLGNNNAKARDWINHLEKKQTPMEPVRKRVRDVIDMDVYERSPHTPDNSPFSSSSPNCRS